MTIFVAETFIIKPGKLGEYRALAEKYITFVKNHQELFKELVSRKGFTHTWGGKVGGCVELSEFNSIGDAEKCGAKITQDQEFMTTIVLPSFDLAILGSYSIKIWNSFP